MTEEQLQAIRRRLENVGEYGKEWTSFDDVNCEDSKMVSEYDALTESGVRWLADCQSEELAEFIAHAREDVPEMLREIDKLRDMMDSAARYLTQGESRLANRYMCAALGVDENHYGYFGKDER